MAPTNQPDQLRSPSRHTPEMFDRVAFRYDLANRVLSCGVDQGWRRRLVRHVPQDRPLSVLDLASGTGDVALLLARLRPNVTQIVGLDISLPMMVLGQRKARATAATPHLEFVAGDAHRLPFPAARFDIVTMAFGLRNLADRPHCLGEMRRVLKPGGRALILEFSLPACPCVRGPYLIYLKHVLPTLGGVLSGNPPAYQYLSSSIQAFPPTEEMRGTMEECGFATVRSEPLTAGIATLYVAEKRDPFTGFPRCPS